MCIYIYIGTTPDITNAAAQLNEWAKKVGAKAVFIATDGTDKDIKLLKSKVQNVHVLRGKGGKFGHPGLNAVIEQWITILADHFIGTQESRFTQSIQEDRDLLGHPQDSTWHHFCGNKATDSKCEGGSTSNWFDPFPPSKQRQAFLAEHNATMPPTVLPGVMKPDVVQDGEDIYDGDDGSVDSENVDDDNLDDSSMDDGSVDSSVDDGTVDDNADVDDNYIHKEHEEL